MANSWGRSHFVSVATDCFKKPSIYRLIGCGDLGKARPSPICVKSSFSVQRTITDSCSIALWPHGPKRSAANAIKSIYEVLAIDLVRNRGVLAFCFMHSRSALVCTQMLKYRGNRTFRVSVSALNSLQRSMEIVEDHSSSNPHRLFCRFWIYVLYEGIVQWIPK